MNKTYQKLYHPHLRPSYTNLQAAEILQVIGKNELAGALTIQAFAYYFELVAADLRAFREPDRLDAYLLRQSASLLEKLGDSSYKKKLAGLGIVN